PRRQQQRGLKQLTPSTAATAYAYAHLQQRRPLNSAATPPLNPRRLPRLTPQPDLRSLNGSRLASQKEARCARLSPAVKPPSVSEIELKSALIRLFRRAAARPPARGLLSLSEFRAPPSRAPDFAEVYRGAQRQFKLTKLSPNTLYSLRVAAVNSKGVGDYSAIVDMATSRQSAAAARFRPAWRSGASAPLLVAWQSGQQPLSEDEFVLQMNDEDTGHGFMTVYSGPRSSATGCRICAGTPSTDSGCRPSNDDGASKWSAEAAYATLPDKPRRRPDPADPARTAAAELGSDWLGGRQADDGGMPLLAY
uniref:Fibronectin type-III domain-containing protein n=1 Tax=Macrostomum lignano TaxID=282301 RepID=A0A1I8F9K5_9PLAT